MFVRKCLAVILLCLFGGAPHAVALGIATHEMLAHSHGSHEAPGDPGLHVEDHGHHHDHEQPQDLTDPAPPVRPREYFGQLPSVTPLVVCSATLPLTSLQTAENPVFTRDGPSLSVLFCSFRI
jgi:hypothetical protein